MGVEKQGSKHGNYVGGFLQLFEWNGKSRKKLFPDRPDCPEKSKQKKRSSGNLPITRLQMLDEDELEAGSSLKGTSDYSCTSSVTDEDFSRVKAPGVVARLMGLDSLPKSNSSDPYSTPLFDCRSLPGAYYKTENLDYRQDSEIMHSRRGTEPKYQRVIHSPLEKFQTETLPPKSAKSIRVTRHKLMSPIKSASMIPPEDAAHIMEAAARIIEPGPQAIVKAKISRDGSTSVPLKAKDFKEKVQACQKPIKSSAASRRPGESTAVKSWNCPVEATPSRSLSDSEESSTSVKSKGKSISLALQAKANVQKREGMNLNSGRVMISQKETSEISSIQSFKSQSSNMVGQKSTVKKASTKSSAGVLRQNNLKQNNMVNKANLASKPKLQCGKVHAGGDSSAAASQHNPSKLVGTSKVSSRKSGSQFKDDKKQVKSSSSEKVTAQSTGDHATNNVQKDKQGRLIHSSNRGDVQSSWDQVHGKTGTDVISFTFSAPITQSERYKEDGGNYKIFSADSRNKRMLLDSDCNKVKGGDTLSALLEQKLKQLSHKVDLPKQKSETGLTGSVLGLNALMSSTIQEENRTTVENDEGSMEYMPATSLYSSTDAKGSINGIKWKYLVEQNGILGSNNILEDEKMLGCCLPHPLSVLEHSSFTGSCSSNTSNIGGGKYCSSLHAMNTIIPSERDAELSDTASSTSDVAEARRQTTILTSSYGKPRGWELEYVKEIICNIEMMFKKYMLGRTCEIINPSLFDQLESRKVYPDGFGASERINRRLMFDCVSEYMEVRCREYVGGGCNLWAKGMKMVKRKERLAEDVYKQISSWNDMGDFMVDELVDNDMSSQCGKWLDFEIEAFEYGVEIESRILNSLIDEVVADILVI